MVRDIALAEIRRADDWKGTARGELRRQGQRVGAACNHKLVRGILDSTKLMHAIMTFPDIGDG